MKQSTQSAEQSRPNLEYGTITSCPENGRYGVVLPFGTVEAQKAASCLLQPIEHDRVLVSVDMEGACYILSVLQRNVEKEIYLLQVPGDCVLHCSSGSLGLRADHSLSMSANKTVEVAGDSLSLTAHKGEAFIGKMSLIGKALHTQVKKITTMAKSMEQSLKQMTQRMENCERFVQDHEEVQTGSTRYLVEDTLTTHAGNTMNISEELHTMHAEQIHMS